MQATATKFELREVAPGKLLMACQGGLSWEDRDLLAASVEQHFRGGGGAGVIIDLDKADFVNSAGVGALFQLARVVHNGGGRLAFINVSPKILRLFRIVGLDRQARVAANVEAAIAALNEAGSVRVEPREITQTTPHQGT
ncbi:MAG: hypothetical protein CHACPFDD_01496 [Phycisphaerae bacterium]|nr:hypothetical protein [Phycisphaerae bacterium]